MTNQTTIPHNRTFTSDIPLCDRAKAKERMARWYAGLPKKEIHRLYDDLVSVAAGELHFLGSHMLILEMAAILRATANERKTK